MLLNYCHRDDDFRARRKYVFAVTDSGWFVSTWPSTTPENMSDRLLYGINNPSEFITRDLVYTVYGPYKHSFHTLDILIMETPKIDNGNI